ncbi:unnamed protein product [Tetraodon nigroviridis]|uniref:(spotted green pufferfish) hypothetical protein n=1 Tax=Tetraodon nigroviridis TaxID=99883 RepID=Q4S3T9_TETNG|nr:unnamed protein product [Tetraodon nigroviridis]
MERWEGAQDPAIQWDRCWEGVCGTPALF